MLHACQQIAERLQPYKASNPQGLLMVHLMTVYAITLDCSIVVLLGTFKDWVSAAYFDRVNLSANGFYKVWALYCGFESAITACLVFNKQQVVRNKRCTRSFRIKANVQDDICFV